MVQIGNAVYDDEMIITSEYPRDIQDKFLPRITEHIKKLGNILDIGSNIGTQAILYSQVIPYKNILCFEPNPTIADIASKNLKKANVNHTVYNIALSNYNGNSHFLNSIHQHQCNKLTNISDISTVPVEVHTLDYFEFEDISFIKIDVEGFELEVLEGSIKTINENRPIINLEYHKEADANLLFKFIDNINYTIIYLDYDGQFIPDRCNQLLLIPN
jgi:FkbM family methyltransferase